MEPEDPGLLEGLRRGHTEAFDVLYERYRPRLYGFLARLVRDRDAAEDLLQETWLRLARRATTLAQDTNLGAWLFTVARNLAVSHHRTRLLHHARLAAAALLGGRTAEVTPFDLASASEAERKIEQAIAALRPAYRETLLLCAVEGFEPAEAAGILGLTPEALRQRLARARAMIAERLEPKAAMARKATSP